MSLMHFDAMTAAAADTAMVNLENIFCSDSGQYGAFAGVTFFSYGEAWCDEGGSDQFLYNWIDPKDATSVPGSPVYQMKRNTGTGSVTPSGPAAEVWTNVTAFLGFGWSVNFGGTGYLIGDTIEWVGGSYDTPVQATVATVSGTAITGLTFTHTGDYGILPTDPISSVATSGGGSGATFNGNSAFDHRVAWGLGAGYGDNEYWDGTISIRKGTGPVLDTATLQIDADAS
jgi:hypothetical protein